MRAQAAIEFLTTYGWGLIGIIIIIAALALIAFTSPDVFAREQCGFGSQLACTDYQLTPDNLSIVLKNGFGEGITIGNPTAIILPEGVSDMTCTPSTNQLTRTGQAEVVCTFTGRADEGARARIALNVTVQRNPTSPVHTITGTVHAKVQ